MRMNNTKPTGMIMILVSNQETYMWVGVKIPPHPQDWWETDIQINNVSRSSLTVPPCVASADNYFFLWDGKADM
jgi:hypothetical protein